MCVDRAKIENKLKRGNAQILTHINIILMKPNNQTQMVRELVLSVGSNPTGFLYGKTLLVLNSDLGSQLTH